ncbi:unnamed protein product [Mytilus edulis]|uniref:Reverse transcriptase domain-containing protein n=1 Tax=Mytilus edulis TaxID=6550 RepID=A0A8S3RN44_MYTED|nr:unnamed protein product [Mytilus edulis]
MNSKSSKRKANASNGNVSSETKLKKPSKKQQKKSKIINKEAIGTVPNKSSAPKTMTNVNNSNTSASGLSHQNILQYNPDSSYLSIVNPSLQYAQQMQSFQPFQQTPHQQMVQPPFCSTPNMVHPPPNSSPSMMSQRPVWVDELFTNMRHIETRLDKLDQIGILMSSMNMKVIQVEQETKSLSERLAAVEISTQYVSDQYEDQKTKCNELKSSVINIEKTINTQHSDVSSELETSNNDDFVSVNGILIHLLLFADDTVLFGKTPEALQLLLDKLLKYCSKWNIEVNKDKTEIIVFRNGWQQVNHSWKTGLVADINQQPFLAYKTGHSEHVLILLYSRSAGTDRRWCLACRPTGGRHINCYWTPHYVNDWDRFFSFQCNNYGFIVGMQSIHQNQQEDRRFRFKCCSIAGKDLSQCHKTFRNQFDKPNTVHVPTGSVVRGVSSTHNNHYEDRQYSWNICKLGRVSHFSSITREDQGQYVCVADNVIRKTNKTASPMYVRTFKPAIKYANPTGVVITLRQDEVNIIRQKKPIWSIKKWQL